MISLTTKRIARTGILGTLFLGTLMTWADTLTIKNGDVVQGTFLSSDGKTIEFQGGVGTMAVEKAKVASVSFGSATAGAGKPDADTLALKNGNVASGTFLGSDGKTLRFESSLGQLTVDKDEVASFTLAGSGASTASTDASDASSKVTLPAGTVLLVKMSSNVSSKSKPGSPFESVLVADLTLDNQVVVKSGTKILGRVQSASEPRGPRGQTTLDIRLTDILQTGQKVQIASSGYRAAGSKGGKQMAKGAAAGAAIGGIADGGEGAAKGAAIGAGVGAFKKGNTITIPPGTLLEFDLVQAAVFTIQP